MQMQIFQLNGYRMEGAVLASLPCPRCGNDDAVLNVVFPVGDTWEENDMARAALMSVGSPNEARRLLETQPDRFTKSIVPGGCRCGLYGIRPCEGTPRSVYDLYIAGVRHSNHEDHYITLDVTILPEDAEHPRPVGRCDAEYVNAALKGCEGIHLAHDVNRGGVLGDRIGIEVSERMGRGPEALDVFGVLVDRKGDKDGFYEWEATFSNASQYAFLNAARDLGGDCFQRAAEALDIPCTETYVLDEEPESVMDADLSP